jgi:hypothetical protein
MKLFQVEASQMGPESLSFGDLIDLCEAAGVDPEEMQSLMAGPKRGARKLRLLCAVAWVVNRREVPGLTYADVLAGQVEIIGTPDSAREARKAKAAKLTAGVVVATGLSPDVVRSMSLSEVAAVVDIKAAR